MAMEAKEAVIIRNKDEMRKWSRKMRSQGKTIGSVFPF
ncbi:pantoate--beta-alanine ligase-like protein [Corchorus olitorius]|uniref:Pantoate--beta-alanine ligase-like protein n=1 Tax=Corchorus olitorius TaxID=93759 RepID=A0A1R3KMB7_9ROSI|nr:pantoate--beta-alanine ligase-like protein [Corchorus olitorius]